MRKLLFYIILCLLVIMLAGCSKPEKKAEKSVLEKAVLQAANVELSNMLMSIQTSQMAYKIEHDVYRECLPSPPDGGTDGIPDVWVDAGGFEDIGFRPDGSVRYQYSVVLSNDGKAYEAIAVGDLDTNGVKVRYTVTDSSRKPKKEPANEY